MIELFLVAAIAFFIFALLFLAFAIKRRAKDEPVHIHTCHNCNCGGQNRHVREIGERSSAPSEHPASGPSLS